MTAQTLVRIILRLAPILAIIIVVFEVIVSNHLVATSQEVQKIEQTIGTFALENDLLRQKVASASAVSTVKFKAQELGFVSAQQVLSFSAEDFSVALAPQKSNE